MTWHEWPIGPDGLPAEDGVVCEVHIVPEPERKRHRPQECWCQPELGLRDGTPLFRHRIRGDDFLELATRRIGA